MEMNGKWEGEERRGIIQKLDWLLVWLIPF
jgi:hypothetical protein